MLGEELIKNGSSELGGMMKEMQETGESVSKGVEITSSFAQIFIHLLHVKEGKNYDSNYEVCKV